MKKVIYIHGWKSSPNSEKLLELKKHYDVIAPTLNENPQESMKIIDDILVNHNRNDIILVGTSIGGYYANHFAEKYGINALIINPCYSPKEFLGLDLPDLKPSHKHISRIVLLAKDDEIIPYKFADELFNDVALVKHFENEGHRFNNVPVIVENIEDVEHFALLL